MEASIRIQLRAFFLSFYFRSMYLTFFIAYQWPSSILLTFQTEPKLPSPNFLIVMNSFKDIATENDYKFIVILIYNSQPIYTKLLLQMLNPYIIFCQMSVKTSTHDHQKCLKNLQQKQNQFKKEKALLEQNVEFLEQQLRQYRQREADNKKLNQSIMITYQQNENIREEHISRSIKIMTEKHQEQLARIKEVSYRQSKALEESLVEYKNKYEQLLIENDRKSIELERKLLEIKKKYDEELRKQLEQRESEYEHKIQVLTQKLKQAESMAQVYQELVQKRRDNYGQTEDYTDRARQSTQMRRSESFKQNVKFRGHNLHNGLHEEIEKQTRKSRLKDIQQNNAKDLRRLSASRESVRQLTAKIERAVTHLKGSNNSKLHQRINQRLAKIIY